jgi:catechol 2,3-dioxygenase-like lactoylglutathione lyase family enzyme
MPAVESLHTVLLCEKWEECVAFYRDVLEFPVVAERRRFVEFRVAPGARIGILRPLRPPSPRPDRDRVILSLCVSDIERAHSSLKARRPDLPAIREHPWGQRVFEFRDPEGWRIEFWSPAAGM